MGEMGKNGEKEVWAGKLVVYRIYRDGPIVLGMVIPTKPNGNNIFWFDDHSYSTWDILSIRNGFVEARGSDSTLLEIAKLIRPQE